MQTFARFQLAIALSLAAPGVTPAAFAGPTVSAPAPQPLAGPKSFQSFADLRNEVLNAIGGATRRIWLTTDYLTDGEIVQQLYLAQYRKLDVQVLLGRAKANFYMSRLSYLKNQSIPVYLRPDSFRPEKSTMLLVDDTLYTVDGELDFLAKYRKFTLEVGTDAARDRYLSAFSGAANLQLPAVPRPIPLVGRAGSRGHIYVPGGVSSSSGGGGGARLPRPDTSGGAPLENGVFVYSRKSPPRPDGVPSRLPKDLKWKQRQLQQRALEQKAAEAAPSSPKPHAEPAADGPQKPAPALPGDDDDVSDKDNTQPLPGSGDAGGG